MRRCWVPVPGRLYHPGPVDTGQPQVGDDDVEGELFEELQRPFTAVGLNDLETTLRQTLRHQAAQGGLVIDDEQVRGGHRDRKVQYLDTAQT